MTFREKIGNILNEPVLTDKEGNGKYKEKFASLNRDGRLDMKKMIKIIAVLCEHAEAED